MYAVLVLQHPAHPDERGALIFRHAHPLAAQVLRCVDAGRGPHVDAGVAENAREERRNADVGRAAVGDRAQEAGERNFANVELREAECPVEYFFGFELQKSHVTTLHRDAAVAYRRRAAVVPARYRDRHLRHRFRLLAMDDELKDSRRAYRFGSALDSGYGPTCRQVRDVPPIA